MSRRRFPPAPALPRRGVPRTTAAAVLVALLLTILAACGDGFTSSVSDPEIELGRSVYAANCAACHGANGEAETDRQLPREDATVGAPPHDSTGHTWHHPDGQSYKIVTRGGKLFDSPTFKSRMPAFG